MILEGAIGSIASAVTVAASSFSMIVTDPTPLLDAIDLNRLEEILGTKTEAKASIRYVEPAAQETRPKPIPTEEPPQQTKEQPTDLSTSPSSDKIISGKVQTLGDFIDTDALAPAEALVGNLSAEELGKFCLYHTHPDFRRRIKEDGLNIVVAGKAFGVGSSRENAVTALQGAGIQCVIARSFAFIYARNQPNLGLLGIVMNDEEFYKLAKDEAQIEIHVDRRIIKVGGKEFEFSLSELEIQLWEQGGMTASFVRWGKGVLERMTTGKKVPMKEGTTPISTHDKELKW
jgi:3-isopropylmalate dehydratase small subunit